MQTAAAFAPPAHDLPSARVHTIHMGEFAAHGGGMEIRTLLGSCVCVCLWDPAARIGGANHFQLPDSGGPASGARYGVHAMEMLINRMMATGADRRRLRALAFGGAAVIPALVRHHVGARNAHFAREFLEAEGIPLLGADLGGRAPRQVRFRTSTGQASVKRLPERTGAGVGLAELRDRERLDAVAASHERGGGDVVLF